MQLKKIVLLKKVFFGKQTIHVVFKTSTFNAPKNFDRLSFLFKQKFLFLIDFQCSGSILTEKIKRKKRFSRLPAKTVKKML